MRTWIVACFQLDSFVYLSYEVRERMAQKALTFISPLWLRDIVWLVAKFGMT